MARPRKTSHTQASDRAVVYLRVSKEDGPKKHGLDVQRVSCAAYLERQGYTHVAECVDDGVSGATHATQRKGLSRAFRLCQQGQADVIVAYHQDRFARKMGVFDEIRDMALTFHMRLETADGRVLTHKDDFLNGDVSALVAAIERRRTAERFYQARRMRSQRDGCGSGVLPFGYLREPGAKDGTLVVDDDAAAIVRDLFARRAASQSYRTVAAALNVAGYTTPTAKRWTTSSVWNIERNAELYRTGIHVWDDVTAVERWPILLPPQTQQTRLQAA